MGSSSVKSADDGALAGLALCALLPSLNVSIANIALPSFTEAFGAPFQAAQWVVVAYLLAVTALIVSVGRLGDMIGRRRLLRIGLAAFAGASLLCALAPTLGLLIAARAAQGIAAAALMALSMALVGETIPKKRAGAAMGLLGTMSAIGTALGPSLGGALIAGFGWRSIFLISPPLALLAFWLAGRFLPRDAARPAASPARFDPLGAGLLAATLGAYALAMTLGGGRLGALNAALLLAALLGLILFIRFETRGPAPLIRIAMFRDAKLSAGFATNALVTTVVMATLVVGPFHLAGALRLDPAEVGLAMSAGPIVSALTGAPAGRLADRFGAEAMTLAGLGAMATGCVLLSIAPLDLGALGYVAPLAVLTCGYATFQAANNAAVMTDPGPEQRGVVSAILNLSRNLGLITGAAAMGAVFAFGSGAQDVAAAPAEAVALGMRLAFRVGAALILLAFVIAIAGRRRGVSRRADAADRP